MIIIFIIKKSLNTTIIYDINTFELFRILDGKGVNEGNGYNEFITVGNCIYYIDKTNTIIKYDIVKNEFTKLYNANFITFIKKILYNNGIIYIYCRNRVFKFDINILEITEAIEIYNSFVYHSCTSFSLNGLVYCTSIGNTNQIEIQLTDLSYSFFSNLGISIIIQQNNMIGCITSNLYNNIIISINDTLTIHRDGKKLEHKLSGTPCSNVEFNDNYMIYIDENQILIKEVFPNFFPIFD